MEEDRSRKGKAKMTAGGIPTRVELNMVASDPALLSKIQPIRRLEGKWASITTKGQGKVLCDISNQIGGSEHNQTKPINVFNKTQNSRTQPLNEIAEHGAQLPKNLQP